MANILAKEMIGLSFPPMMESKIKVLRVFEMIGHDGRACIYGAFVSVDTNDILMNDEFPILDVGRKIILEDNGEEGFNVSSFMNEAILKGFKRAFGIVWSGPLVMDFCEETIKLNEFELIDDVVAKGEEGFNVSSFMNEAILKGFKRAFGIVWSGPLVMDFWYVGFGSFVVGFHHSKHN
nr:hypothetical protein [Tanacetum cinerariifolium]